MFSWVSGMETLFDRRPPCQMGGAAYALKMNGSSSNLPSCRQLSREFRDQISLEEGAKKIIAFELSNCLSRLTRGKKKKILPTTGLEKEISFWSVALCS